MVRPQSINPKPQPKGKAIPDIYSHFSFSKVGYIEDTGVAKANLEANIVSTLQAGCFVGALAAYWFADRIGRKPSLMYSALLALAGTILQAASSGYLGCLYVGR